MQYRTVPKNGDRISVLGYGCMRFPGKRQNIDEELSMQQLYSAIDRGVNYIDTAWPYHRGKSEPFLGKVLSQSGYRDKIKLATKQPHWITPSIDKMHEVLDKQLEKLQTDRIDYYLVHNLNGATWARVKETGVLEFLDQAKKSGRIINAGFSFHGAPKDFTPIVDAYDWEMCLIQYNYLDTLNQAGTAGLEYAASKNLAVFVMEPMRGGNLAKQPPAEVRTIWQKSDVTRTPVGWALGWVLNHPEVTCVLSGMNSPEQITENLEIADRSMPNTFSQADLALVEEAADTYRTLMKVNCTGCQYCMPCPAGVNIPVCFETYNTFSMFKDSHAKMVYLINAGGVLEGKRHLASQCTGCGACIKKCPQGIDIPTELKAVEKTMQRFWTRPLLWLAGKLLRIRKAGKQTNH